MKRLLGAVLAAAAIGALVSIMSSTSACIDFNEPDGGVRATTILAPDQTAFQTVSPVFERRCGTLDCHGQEGRPLRIYSGLGLRLPNDAGNFPGTTATTPDEITTNYRTVIGLEPEEMTRVIAGEDVPRDLLILKKPLMLEAHKGGPAFAPSGDPGETCITSWIDNALDKNACNQAVAGF
ncbi:MAG TPA: hypothetical protein VGH28_30230 [Polyangiaceae bacterium]